MIAAAGVGRPGFDGLGGDVNFTRYFAAMRDRPDRAVIHLEWVERVVDHPEKEMVQADGRIRRWVPIAEMEGRYLRVILLPDGQTRPQRVL